MSEAPVQKTIKLDNVRLLRVSLTKPYIGKDAKVDPATGKQEGKYHIDAVFAPTHPQFGALSNVIRGVCAARWKEQTQQTIDMIKDNNQRWPLQKGDKYRPGKPAYAGMLYISAGNRDQPTILVTENGVNLSNRWRGRSVAARRSSHRATRSGRTRAATRTCCWSSTRTCTATRPGWAVRCWACSSSVTVSA